jgi:hypothetical protein
MLAVVLACLGITIAQHAAQPYPHPPWAVDVMPGALLFFWAGHVMRHDRRIERAARLACLPVGLLGLGLQFGAGMPGS